MHLQMQDPSFKHKLGIFRAAATMFRRLETLSLEALGNVTLALNVNVAVNVAFYLLVKLEVVLLWMWPLSGHSCKSLLMSNHRGCISVCTDFCFCQTFQRYLVIKQMMNYEINVHEDQSKSCLLLNKNFANHIHFQSRKLMINPYSH